MKKTHLKTYDTLVDVGLGNNFLGYVIDYWTPLWVY